MRKWVCLHEQATNGQISNYDNYISAPKAFSLKQTEKKMTQAKDPFSTDREYSLPAGDGFSIKKSDEALTEFDEFTMGEHDWKVWILAIYSTYLFYLEY